MSYKKGSDRMNNFEINLNLYRSFYYVAKYGGFTKASKIAMISQSALSSNIKNLEECLSKKLFDRKVSEVSLTKDGKELFLKVEEVFNILNSSIDKKEINIGCVRFIADNYLDTAIVEFKNQFPNIRLNFDFQNVTELYQLLKKDEIDLIISRYPLFYKFEQYIQVEKIKDVENVFVCSASFYEKEKEKMKSDNYIYPLILPNSSEKRRNIEQYLIDMNIIYNVEVEIPNSNLLRKLIMNNIGIGYINKKSVQQEIDSGIMVELKNFKNLPIDNISIIYNSKKNNKIVASFIEILKNTIRNINN